MKRYSHHSETQPDISIIVLTYNHENYIEQCLNSIDRNLIDLNCEIIIYNDASSDDTHLKVLNFLEERFLCNEQLTTIYLKSEERRYGKYNEAFVFNEIFEIASGRYIAFCDGDDFWVDGKLKLQYESMAADPKLAMSFGPSHVVDESGKHLFDRNRYSSNEARTLSVRELIVSGGGLFHTSNSMIKIDVVKPWTSWLDEHFTGDFPLSLNACLHGKVIFLPNVWANYRVLKQSISHNENLNREQKLIRASQIYNKNIEFFFTLTKLDVISSQLIDKAISAEKYRHISRVVECSNAKISLALTFKYFCSLHLKDKFKVIARYLKKMVKIAF